MATLERTTFATSRLLDFCSEKELTAQTGHDPEDGRLSFSKNWRTTRWMVAKRPARRAGDPRHRGRQRNHACRQRPRYPRRDHWKATGLFRVRVQQQGSLRQPDPWRTGQRAKDHSRHAVCLGRRAAARWTSPPMGSATRSFSALTGYGRNPPSRTRPTPTQM